MYQHDSVFRYGSRPKWGRAINSWMARLVVACIALAFTSSPARGQITLEETVTGGTNNTSIVTLPLINGGTDQSYVLAIATKLHSDVTSVTGGGLVWTEQVEQCAPGNEGGMRIWTAQGSPGAQFAVQFTYDAANPVSAAVLSRYTGVATIINPTGENVAGENGSCADGPETSLAQLTLDSTENGSVHVLAVSPGKETVSSVSSGYTLNGSESYGNGMSKTSTYMYEKTFDPAATDTFQATLSADTWWATGGVVLSPGGITRRETVTGGTNSSSPVTLPLINGGTDQTYVLAIATRLHDDVTAVTGGGLAWTERVEQCAVGNEGGMRIWTAQGSPGAQFAVQFTYDVANPVSAAVLSRYSGVGAIIDPTGENGAGESGSCADGPTTSPAQLTLTSTDDRSMHVLGVSPGKETVSSVSSGYTLNGSESYGNGMSKTSAYMYEKTFDPAATDTFQATLSTDAWWATGGVVLSMVAAAPTVFVDVSSAVGFDVQTSGTQPSGLHFSDYDNDGDLDAIITGEISSRLLTSVNEGQSFTASIFGGGNRPGQGAMIDIDNDGDLDFWHADEKLFDNSGSASFSDAGDLGFGEAISTSGVATADINGDGYADLLMFSTNGNWIGFHDGKVVATLTGTDDPSYGLVDAGSVGSGGFVAAADVNNDGHLDFYYHYNGGKLFLSQGDGTFVQNASGISVNTASNKPVGATFGDYDNDGDVDLFVPQYDSGSFGYLWRNDGGTFTDVAVAAGIMNTSGQRGAAFGDYDNDGDLDLYICTYGAANVLYENQGDGTFVEAFVGAGTTGKTQDVVFVDYDNDGDLDLAMTQEGAANVLLQNTTDDTNYLKVRVIGHGLAMTNKAAIGVRVELYEADGTTFLARREIGVASGFGGTEPIWIHFGGVTNSATYVVKVYFAHGVTDVTVVPQNVSTTIGSVTIAQMLTVVEGSPRIAGWREVDPR